MYQDNLVLFTIKLPNGQILENCYARRETKNIKAKGGRGSAYQLNFTDYITHVYDMNGVELSEDDVNNCEIINVYCNEILI